MHNVIIPIKSLLHKDQNHYYYRIFLDECSYQLGKEKLYAAKKSIKIWEVNVNNIVISKLVKTKTNSKYLIGNLDKSVRPLVLIMRKMSGYVKTFKVKDGDKD